MEGEDTCLSLNVWTPSVDAEAKKPVLVWLHGGGYTSGTSAEHRIYEGYNLAKYGDIVFVSINHRLNYLGFLDLSDYGDAYKYSANLSFVDIVCALNWVQDNIAAYGGDPDCVTIVGQSGGGGKAATMMGVPSAEGLFCRAVAQSGGSAYSNRTPEESKAQTQALVESLGLADASPEEVVQYLKDLPYDELAAACQAVQYTCSPVNDGDFYTGGDIFLFFRNTLNVADYWIMGDEEGAEKCSKTMADALVAFMKTGDPSTEKLAWPAFTVEEGATMIFDVNSAVRYYHDAKLQELLPAGWAF